VKTTSQYPDYNSMPAMMKTFFFNHFKRQIEELESRPYYDEAKKETTTYGINRACEQVFNDKAALMPEFGKIICVCLGAIDKGVLKTKCFSGEEDKAILDALLKLPTFTDTLANKETKDICSHGIKHFTPRL
jgi:hypothetical protein